MSLSAHDGWTARRARGHRHWPLAGAPASEAACALSRVTGESGPAPSSMTGGPLGPPGAIVRDLPTGSSTPHALSRARRRCWAWLSASSRCAGLIWLRQPGVLRACLRAVHGAGSLVGPDVSIGRTRGSHFTRCPAQWPPAPSGLGRPAETGTRCLGFACRVHSHARLGVLRAR